MKERVIGTGPDEYIDHDIPYNNRQYEIFFCLQRQQADAERQLRRRHRLTARSERRLRLRIDAIEDQLAALYEDAPDPAAP